MWAYGCACFMLSAPLRDGVSGRWDDGLCVVLACVCVWPTLHRLVVQQTHLLMAFGFIQSFTLGNDILYI